MRLSLFAINISLIVMKYPGGMNWDNIGDAVHSVPYNKPTNRSEPYPMLYIIRYLIKYSLQMPKQEPEAVLTFQ